jgi:hypothetical protein
MILESRFKADLIEEIEALYPGAIVLKTDANQIQGFPDNLILCDNKWAAFEAKRDISASIRPNQKHYVQMLNSMSYASFVFPQNKEKFLNELQQTFQSTR